MLPHLRIDLLLKVSRHARPAAGSPETIPVSGSPALCVPDFRDTPGLELRFAEVALLPVKLAVTNLSTGEVHIFAPGTVPVTWTRLLGPEAQS